MIYLKNLIFFNIKLNISQYIKHFKIMFIIKKFLFSDVLWHIPTTIRVNQHI